MRTKLQYIIIGILVVSNLFFIFNSKKKSIKSNSDFKSEINYLKKTIKFDEKQIKLAIKEYKRYDSTKKEIEKRFRKFDLIMMEDIEENKSSNIINMSSYYDIAILINIERMNHWKKIREIANEDQNKKLDSVWSNIKKRIRETD